MSIYIKRYVDVYACKYHVIISIYLYVQILMCVNSYVYMYLYMCICVFLCLSLNITYICDIRVYVCPMFIVQYHHLGRSIAMLQR